MKLWELMHHRDTFLKAKGVLSLRLEGIEGFCSMHSFISIPLVDSLELSKECIPQLHSLGSSLFRHCSMGTFVLKKISFPDLIDFTLLMVEGG
jgi:hypothetical protein